MLSLGELSLLRNQFLGVLRNEGAVRRPIDGGSRRYGAPREFLAAAVGFQDATSLSNGPSLFVIDVLLFAANEVIDAQEY